MKNLAESFSLLIKPASADCNLHCSYCFYLDRSRLYPESKVHRMSSDVLERLIAGYMATAQRVYSFNWQGGEPLLLGVDFFRKVISLQQKYGRPGSIVHNGLQTNATLITDALAAHLAEYKFLVGVSLDGPSPLHDRYRRNLGGKGSHARVLRGIEILKKHGVEFNALVLVSAANIGRPREVYRYLCDLGIHFHQYIPCLEFDQQGRLLSYGIEGRQWGEFLKEIFDLWIQEDRHRVSVRLFDAILGKMVEGSYVQCTLAGNCCQYLVVEYNGDVYPCDFFVEPRRRLGNIMKHGWVELNNSGRYRRFGRMKAEWNPQCSSCPYLEFCSGDCLKHRLYHENPPTTLSWLCSGWKAFYEHTLPAFERLALSLINERAQSQQHLPSGSRRHDQHQPQQHLPKQHLPKPKIGWKDPCYCGSGKHYRQCHGLSRSNSHTKPASSP